MQRANGSWKSHPRYISLAENGFMDPTAAMLPMLESSTAMRNYVRSAIEYRLGAGI